MAEVEAGRCWKLVTRVVIVTRGTGLLPGESQFVVHDTLAEVGENT